MFPNILYVEPLALFVHFGEPYGAASDGKVGIMRILGFQSRTEQNGRPFVNDIFKSIFFNQIFRIFI